MNYLKILAALESLQKIKGVAYSGGLFMQWWSPVPLVVDLTGMEISPQVPLLYSHTNDPQYRLGVVDAKADKQLSITGGVDPETPFGKMIISAGKKYSWQMSIGATVLETKDIPQDEKVTVNGQEFTGPITIITKSKLREVSVVAVGADPATSMEIAASLMVDSTNNIERLSMDPKLMVFIRAKYSLGEVGETAILAHLKSINSTVEAESAEFGKQTPPKTIEASAQTNASAAPNVEAAAKAAAEAAVAKERARVADIKAVCGGEFADIENQAVASSWTVDQTREKVLAAMREKRPAGLNVVIAGKSTESESFESTVTAAAMLAGGISSDVVAKDLTDKVVEAAQRKYRTQISLQQMIIEAAWRNGYSGALFRGNERDILQAAFSSNSFAGILSNVANKFLLNGFTATEQTWRQISAIRSVNDFKTVTSYRLTDNAKFEKIAPGGEIKHGSFGEESYTNRVDSYGKLVNISRNDIINDDLGALTVIPQRIGRGAGLSLNEIFWKEFLADAATFFSTDNKNLCTGTASALSIAAMSAARTKFAKQVDANGNPLGVLPAICLVPVELEDTAAQLFNDIQVNEAPADAPKLASNPNKGKLRPVASQYLSAANISGNSSTAWYTLANPADIPTIETAFLYGNQSPVIESSALDFSVLGIQCRGYFDFGVNKQDPRGAVKSSGVN